MLTQSKRPLVIVTGPDKKLRFGWWATRLMLWLVGLRGLYLTASSACIPEGAQGIVIGGGDDIEPVHYGLDKSHKSKYDPERDRLEMIMAKRALESGIPMIGICRGSQLINIVLGGSLFTDIRPKRVHTPNTYTIFPVKCADMVDGSRLGKILQKPTIRINSLHNQAINGVGDSLQIAARDRDGFVQAIESTEDSRFLIGVQWHPEYMPYSSAQRKLFRAFAGKIREKQIQFKSEPLRL